MGTMGYIPILEYILKSASDQKNAIETLCKAMMDSFGYDAKAVVPALRGVGINASDRHMRNCTVAVRTEIDAKRDAKIAELHEEGNTQRVIASSVGCDVSTVNRLLVAKRNSAEMQQEPTATPVDTTCPFDNEESGPEFTGFEEEEDEAPVVNPAEHSPHLRRLEHLQSS